MAASVSLPSTHDPRATGYGPPAPQGHGYPSDPRYASPSTTNSYPPSQQSGGGHLPPLQPQSDPRAPSYSPPKQYGAGRQPGPYQPDLQYPPYEAYYYCPPQQGPHGPSNASPYPPQGAGGPYHKYGPSQAGGPAMAQAAPRQRTSIACKYCRKRKIRCSGYQSAPGGNCQNCARMSQKCIFQPVSSSNSTAFIPVSAVPGGVPPGNPLHGAYGQPLAPQPHPYAPGAPGQQQPPPRGGYYAHPQAGQPSAQAPQGHHGPPAQSPAESSYSYSSAGGGDEGSQSGSRRRRRASEDQDESYRLPPSRVGAEEEELHRMSPAEFSSKSNPGGLGLPPLSRHSPWGNPLLPHHGHSTHDGHSPMGHNGSSGASTPAQAGQQAQKGTSVMSLGNLVDKNDIDKGMIDRLNRPRDPSAPRW